MKVAFVQVEGQDPHFGSLNQFSSLNSSKNLEGYLNCGENIEVMMMMWK